MRIVKSFELAWIILPVALACSSTSRQYGSPGDDGGASGGGGSDSVAGDSGTGGDNTGGSNPHSGGSGGSGGDQTATGGSGGDQTVSGGSGGNLAGTGGNSESGGSGGVPSGCESGTCCIAGQEVFPGVLNPNNACESCQPDVNVTAWSPVANSTPCGNGCVCSAGKRSEAVCSDLADNDADGKSNCEDLDCAGKICQPRVTKGEDVSRDLSRHPVVGGVTEVVDGTTISVSSNQSGETYAVFEFNNFPSDTAMTVHKAELSVFVQTGAAKLQVKDPDFKNFGAESSTASDNTIRRFDITSLVQKWVNGSETRKYVTLHRGATSTSNAIVGTKEGGQTPTVQVDFESKCNPQKACPKP